MTLFRILGCSLTLILLLMACNPDLSKQQLELEKRELALQEKENAFALKQADYQLLLKMKDSIVTSRDSIVVHPKLEQIEGKWKGKIVCIESSCPEYVVGDTRIDDWQLSMEHGIVTAKNMNKSGYLRVYKGAIDGNQLKLEYTSAEEASKKLSIQIVFSTISATRLSGTRTVRIDGNCQSNYTIELSR